MPRVSGRRFSALEIGTWSFANLDVFLTSFSPLASLLHSHSSFLFLFFHFSKARRSSCGYQIRGRFITSIITSSSSRVYCPPFSHYAFSLSLSFSSFSFSSSFIFIPLFRTRCDPISVHTCTNCENGIPRTLKDNCFPIDLRSRLLAIRHCICTFALRQHQRCHVWW